VVSQYDIQTMVQIYATAQAATRAVATDIRKAIADPPGRAARQPRRAARPGRDHGQRLRGLLFGLLGAIVLIYLLIVVNFQSWSDPFVIITALPAALAGIVWMLFTTQTRCRCRR